MGTDQTPIRMNDTPTHFVHQARVLDESKELPAYALFWEQGTGKTRTLIDTIVHNARAGQVDAALIVTDKGVHRQWIEDEIPKWLGQVPDRYVYGHNTQAARTQMKLALLAPFPWVAMNWDAFLTVQGKAWARQYLVKRKVFMILDESTAIKTPGARRTKTLVVAGQYARMRRIATGTPVTNSPFDIYSQMRFLDANFWRRAGFATFGVFKSYFALIEQRRASGGTHLYPHILGYRRLDELQQLLAPVSSRVTKDEALDLPPKLYSKRYFDLTPEQRRVYLDLRQEALAWLASGDLITAPLAIVRLLRLQQVTCNHLPSSNGNEPTQPVDSENPRLSCLAAALAEISHQGIIWARFRRDVDVITAMLGNNGVRYDGAVNDADRLANKQAWLGGEVQWLVANPAAAAKGHNLTAARTVIYYSNSFDLELRIQSEDRAHRAGQRWPVEYIDIVAPGTVDEHIVKTLRSKTKLAATITGDQLKEWI